MEKNSENNKYEKLRGMSQVIAEASDSTCIYVRQVLKGTRRPRTQRPSKAHVVLAKADELLAAINNLTV